MLKRIRRITFDSISAPKSFSNVVPQRANEGESVEKVVYGFILFVAETTSRGTLEHFSNRILPSEYPTVHKKPEKMRDFGPVGGLPNVVPNSGGLVVQRG